MKEEQRGKDDKRGPGNETLPLGVEGGSMGWAARKWAPGEGAGCVCVKGCASVCVCVCAPERVVDGVVGREVDA